MRKPKSLMDREYNTPKKKREFEIDYTVFQIEVLAENILEQVKEFNKLRRQNER